MTATEKVRGESPGLAPAGRSPIGLATSAAMKSLQVRAARRRQGRTLLPLLVAALAGGCGGAPRPMYPAVTGPHGIPAISIPGDLGYGEARLESPAEVIAGRGTRREQRTGPTRAARLTGVKKGSPARIVVYFLAPDGRTPLTPLPERVQAVIGLPGTLPNKYTKAYDLANEPRGDDPNASARFASPPFPLPEQRITGRIKAVVGGQEVSFPLALAGTPSRDQR